MSLGRGAVIAIFLFINSLFIYKYGGRAFAYPEWLCVGHLLIVLGLLRYSTRLPSVPTNWVVIGAVSWILLVTVAVHFVIPLSALNVDRWSVIASFWQTLTEGEYPYFARSHMGNPPGPMPIYFVVAAPFHAIGWQELLSALGYLGAVVWIGCCSRRGIVAMLLLVTSPFLYWEIAVRSNIFTYSLLVLLGLELFLQKQNYPRAVMVGLALSTRSVFALAYVVYYLRILRRSTVNSARFFWMATVSAVAFLASFLPLLLIWPEEFHAMNPFIVQGSFLIPPVAIGLFFAGAVVASYVLGKLHPALVSGVLLFGMIAVYALYHVVQIGWSAAYLESKIDISYFLFCVPFLGYYFVASTNDSASAVRAVPRTTVAPGSREE